MKTVIIYTSQTGFTKRYANWLAEKVQGDILTIDEAKNKNPSESEQKMAEMLSRSYDISDEKYVEPIVEYLCKG